MFRFLWGVIMHLTVFLEGRFRTRTNIFLVAKLHFNYKLSICPLLRLRCYFVIFKINVYILAMIAQTNEYLFYDYFVRLFERNKFATYERIRPFYQYNLFNLICMVNYKPSIYLSFYLSNFYLSIYIRQSIHIPPKLH